MKETAFRPPPVPVQKPRIPIWVVGAWPSEKSMQRALRYDGLLPQVLKSMENTIQAVELDALPEIKQYIVSQRSQQTPFDIVVEGKTTGNDSHKAASIVQKWAEAGRPGGLRQCGTRWMM